MNKPVRDKPVAGLVDASRAETIEVLGPTIQFLTPVEPDPAIGEHGPCVMRGRIPPGVSVPLHSHADPETFLVASGEVEAFVESADGFKPVRVRPGEIFHVPGGAKHAFRNEAAKPAEMIIVSTIRIARFFREVGMPKRADKSKARPTLDDQVRHFLQVADKYGYWNATPEENARLGISLPAAA